MECGKSEYCFLIHFIVWMLVSLTPPSPVRRRCVGPVDFLDDQLAAEKERETRMTAFGAVHIRGRCCVTLAARVRFSAVSCVLLLLLGTGVRGCRPQQALEPLMVSKPCVRSALPSIV